MPQREKSPGPRAGKRRERERDENDDILIGPQAPDPEPEEESTQPQAPTNPPVVAQTPQLTHEQQHAAAMSAGQGNPTDGRRSNGTLVNAKAWCFTLWEEEKPSKPAQVDYLLAQQETAKNPAPNNPTQGRHWQGYLELPVRATVRQIRGMMNWKKKKVYLTPRNGTQAQAIEYCKKKDTAVEGTMFEEGEKHDPAAPERWPQMQHIVQSGGDLRECFETNFQMTAMYTGGIQKAINLYAKPEEDERQNKCYYLWGDTGTGKSKTVRAIAKRNGLGVYAKMDCRGQSWYDGYENEEVLLLDDFYGDGMSLQEFLRITDVYRQNTQVKGSSVWARWSRVYVTANKPFEKLFPNATEKQREALERRFPPCRRYEFRKPKHAHWRETQITVGGPPTEEDDVDGDDDVIGDREKCIAEAVERGELPARPTAPASAQNKSETALTMDNKLSSRNVPNGLELSLPPSNSNTSPLSQDDAEWNEYQEFLRFRQMRRRMMST